MVSLALRNGKYRKYTNRLLLQMKTNMSTDYREFIILFKAVSETEKEGDDNYSNLFLSANFQVTLIPVLDFEFANLNELTAKLKKSDDYEGIIFTSPRCVQAVDLSLREGDGMSLLKKWEGHKHFVVGEKTAKMVEKFNLIPYGKEAGNAKNLAEIMSKEQFSKPFLYLKGSLTKETFKLQLSENSIQVDEIMVYKTKPHAELETNIQKIKTLCLSKIVHFIYFSPSGVNSTLPLLKKHKFDLNKIKFVAIGPTTEQSLKENGLTVAATAAKPEPQALVAAVVKYNKAKNLMTDGSTEK